MQNVDHADVSCLLLHYFFIKEFLRGKGKKKEKIGGGICLWLVWVYVEKWIDDDDDDGGGDGDDDDDRQSPSFFFVFLVHVHVHVPFGHIGMIRCIDDDMNNEHVHFFVLPSFFSCSFGTYLRYLGTSYEVYLLDGDTYAFDDLQFIAAEDRSSERFRTPNSFIIIITVMIIGHSLFLTRQNDM